MRKIIFICIWAAVGTLFAISGNSEIWLKIIVCIAMLAVVCYGLIKEFKAKDKSKNRLIFRKKHNLIIFIVVFAVSGSFLTLSSVANLLYPEEQMWMHSLLAPGFLGFMPTVLVFGSK